MKLLINKKNLIFLSFLFTIVLAQNKSISGDHIRLTYGHLSFDDRSNSFFGESDILKMSNDHHFMDTVQEGRKYFDYVAEGWVNEKDKLYLQEDAIWAVYRESEGELLFIDHLLYKTNYSIKGEFASYYFFTAPSLNTAAQLQKGDLLFPTGRQFQRKEQIVFKLIDEENPQGPTLSIENIGGFLSVSLNPSEYGLAMIARGDIFPKAYWGLSIAGSYSNEYLLIKYPFGLLYRLGEKSLLQVGSSAGVFTGETDDIYWTFELSYSIKMSELRGVQFGFLARTPVYLEEYQDYDDYYYDDDYDLNNLLNTTVLQVAYLRFLR